MNKPNPDNAAHIGLFVLIVTCLFSLVMADHFHTKTVELQQVIQQKEDRINAMQYSIDSLTLFTIYEPTMQPDSMGND